MNLVLTDSQLEWAKKVAQGRIDKAIELQRPAAWGYDGKNRFEVDLIGTVSELAVSLATGQKWNDEILDAVSSKGRKQVDVGESIQVRSTAYKTGCLILHDSDADDETFVLAVVDKDFRKVKIAGWIAGKEGKNKKYWRAVRPEFPAYFIPQDALRPIQSFGCSDQYKIHESSADRDRQRAILQAFCNRFQVAGRLTEKLAEYDAEIFTADKAKRIGLAEVKFRNNAFTKYPDYQIDMAKIDALIAAARREALKAILIVSWQGDVQYLDLSKASADWEGYDDLFPVTSTKRNDRQELPDLQYHIPLNLFRKI